MWGGKKNPKKKRKNSKKIEKSKIQKIRKKENPKKIEKGKIQKNRKTQNKKKKKKKNKNKKLFSVVLDKICVFHLYPILDSQQYVKRGSCRRPILSGLLVYFHFVWASGPFVARFEFGPRTLSFSFYLFILSSLWVVFVLAIYFMFISYQIVICHVVLFHIVPCFSYLFTLNVVLFI